MSLSITTNLATLPGPDPSRAKAKNAAQDFEAVLLGSLMDSLQKTFSGKTNEASAGASNYGFMGAQALASTVAARGGIGIAEMILKSWATHPQTVIPSAPDTSVPPVYSAAPPFSIGRSE
jgi:peptidoglycan hydrolase FlgJ